MARCRSRGTGEPADPLQTPPGIKPEWYFLPTYQLLKYFSGPMGKFLGILVSGVPFLLLIAWPLLDRTPARAPGKRPFARRIGIFAILLAVFFGIVGHISENTYRFWGVQLHFDMYGMPHLLSDGEPKSAETAPNDEHKPSPGDNH